MILWGMRGILRDLNVPELPSLQRISLENEASSSNWNIMNDIHGGTTGGQFIPGKPQLDTPIFDPLRSVIRESVSHDHQRIVEHFEEEDDDDGDDDEEGNLIEID